jgi:subtilisin family serine protease
VYFTPIVFFKRFDKNTPSDRNDLAELMKKGSPYVLKQESLPGDQVKVSFQGFELKLPMASAETAERATRALETAAIPNVTFTHPDTEKRALKLQSASIDPRKYVQTCLATNQLPPDSCAYSLLGGMTAIDSGNCREGGRCADVYLLDKLVFKDPAFAGVVTEGLIEKPGEVAPSGCGLVQLKDASHGTHLAGIIAANGPVCVGLNPAVRLHSWDSEADGAVTTDKIDAAQNQHDSNPDTVALPIFVFASSWKFATKNGQAGQLLDNSNDRLQKPIASQINNGGALWIVAAGQADPTLNEHAVEITPKLALGPMNLGDLRNLLVVSACRNCLDSHPALLDNVNYSRTMVHLAAPGDDMPGPIGGGRLGLGGGTSQATAFVAGIASAMVARYPNSFPLPYMLKARLQYTSRPVLTGNDAQSVATGVLDPSVALLAPGKDYWQPLGSGTLTAATVEWCSASIQLNDPDTAKRLSDNGIPTGNVMRIYRVNRESDAPPQLILYTRNLDRPGEIQRIGPGVLSNPKPAQGIFKAGGVPVSAGKFLDLMVHDPKGLPVVPCTN